MSKPKVIKLERNGKEKIFMEVQFEEDKILGVGKPFKIYGACQLVSPDKVELVIEEVEHGKQN